jgi:2-dehydro-3-deoxyphosphogalactonate aldolase
MIPPLEDIRHVGIIRGVDPEKAAEVTGAFYDSGFRAIEVPLNSPEPLKSIRRMVDAYGDRMLIGAGTVMTPRQVQEVADAGGRIIVSPNCNPVVIAEVKKLGLISMPGVMTPTDCFMALENGADGLKLFPADVVGIGALVSYLQVLPRGTSVYAVGGVTADNAQEWMDAGAAGVGVATCCFTPRMTIGEVRVATGLFFS